MYKVFLVDDEIVVREGIRSNFPWEETDFVLAGEAPDGEIALSMIQDIKPDILITDIKMPFMDGLELCRSAMRTMRSSCRATTISPTLGRPFPWASRNTCSSR